MPLEARASELEQPFAFGVVRQLLEPVVNRDSEHAGLFAGAAGPAARLFEPNERRPLGADVGFEALHSLYWLVVNIADQNLAILTNRDVLAVDQDPLGVQAQVVSSADSHWTLRKPLAGGDTAVALFNAGSTPWSGGTVQLDPATTYLAKDLFTKAVPGLGGAAAAPDVASHDIALLRLSTRGPQLVAPKAQATQATGVPVSFATSATDAFGDALAPACTHPSGTTFPIGPTQVTCTATDAAGRSASAGFEVDVLPPPHPLDVSGTVPATPR